MAQRCALAPHVRFSVLVLPRFGVDQPLWLYAIAFFVVGAVG